MSKQYIAALDAGTTSCRTLIIAKNGEVIGKSHKEFRQIYPQAGWVEHDPMEILRAQQASFTEALQQAKITPASIAAVGIANQRETVVVWNKKTGLPVYNAIVWQCRRTAEACAALARMGKTDFIKDRTGLLLDAYFSATKIAWILDHAPHARAMAENGELLAGTIDTWLVWQLSGGKTFVTDPSNACRTMLFNIHTLQWDAELAALFRIPLVMLPEVKESSFLYGETDAKAFGAAIPIGGIAGDQQAALFGQRCLNKGDVKITYGTGCFLLMNTGRKPVFSSNGLLTSVAWSIRGKTVYALEGSIFMAGAIVQWFRDDLGLISSSSEADRLAESVSDSAGVYLAPAFQGFGAPDWDMNARGAILGLTRAAQKAHIVRAGLEAAAYSVVDVVKAMEYDAGHAMSAVKADGGMSKSDFTLQFQADILQKEIIRPRHIETTALGAAFLAGMAIGFWRSEHAVEKAWRKERVFKPRMADEKRIALLRGWHKAKARAKYWV